MIVPKWYCSISMCNVFISVVIVAMMSQQLLLHLLLMLIQGDKEENELPRLQVYLKQYNIIFSTNLMLFLLRKGRGFHQYQRVVNRYILNSLPKSSQNMLFREMI